MQGTARARVQYLLMGALEEKLYSVRAWSSSGRILRRMRQVHRQRCSWGRGIAGLTGDGRASRENRYKRINEQDRLIRWTQSV